MSAHYPPRTPRLAHGIRVQDLRTLSRRSWWARRWIQVLESMRLGARFGRGRLYATSGQVTQFTREGSHVSAYVQGSRSSPYHVQLDFTPISAHSQIPARLLNEKMLLARVLTHDFPLEIEQLFRDENQALFPRTESLGETAEGKKIWDVHMSCTCPDWMRPCKHLVAVLLLLGEEISQHPATLLALRGIDLEELLPVEKETPLSEIEWDQSVTKGENLERLKSPLFQRLGSLAHWRSANKCPDCFIRIATRVRPAAQAGAQGESIDLRS